MTTPPPPPGVTLPGMTIEPDLRTGVESRKVLCGSKAGGVRNSRRAERMQGSKAHAAGSGRDKGRTGQEQQ